MSQPLPEILRPQSLTDYVGQSDIVGENKIVNKLLENYQKSNFFPSLILWGPPGTGKTTIARIIAKELGKNFIELSAVSASSKEIKNIEKDSVLFLDEIHRFNKAQQDRLLPHVEKGEFILIGATTENPSFEVISPLLSRCRVLVLKQFTPDELDTIVDKALGYLKVKIKPDAKEFLVEAANGDARVILNVLEIAASLSSKSIAVADIEQALQRRQLGFDKKGDEFYNIISAFIKSMRASQPDAALYYLARMVEAGQDPLYIARRMIIFASEDIGMEQPTALVVANEVFRACEIIGYPECAINLAHGVVYLSLAKKSKASYYGLQEALADVRTHGNLPTPLKIRNAPTKLMKNLDYGKGYEKYDTESYLPDKLKNKKYYSPDK